MFGLPIWTWQLAVLVLKGLGLDKWAGAVSIKLALRILKAFENVKTFHQNSDFPQPPPALNMQRNFNV